MKRYGLHRPDDMNSRRPEDYASASPLGRRMAWETRHPDLETRPPVAASKLYPERAARMGWDVANRASGAVVAGPWATVEAMMDDLERADKEGKQPWEKPSG